MENETKPTVPGKAIRIPCPQDIVRGLNHTLRLDAANYLWVLVPTGKDPLLDRIMYADAYAAGLTEPEAFRLLVRAILGLDAIFQGYAIRQGLDASQVRRAVAEEVAQRCAAPESTPVSVPIDAETAELTAPTNFNPPGPAQAYPEPVPVKLPHATPHPDVLSTLEKLNVDLQTKCREAEQARKATDEALAQAEKLRDEAAQLRMDLDQARELARHYEHAYRDAIMRHEECAGFMARKSLEVDALRKNLNEVSKN